MTYRYLKIYLAICSKAKLENRNTKMIIGSYGNEITLNK
jgi:hypothetical protein